MRVKAAVRLDPIRLASESLPGDAPVMFASAAARENDPLHPLL